MEISDIKIGDILEGPNGDRWEVGNMKLRGVIIKDTGYFIPYDQMHHYFNHSYHARKIKLWKSLKS